MSYQSGDILISEFDGFVNDIYVIVEEAVNTHYKSYVVYSREQDINLVYPEIYLLNTTVSGEEYRSKYGIKK
jgi:hypothetical protein